MILYFVSGAENLFLHSLGQQRKSSASAGTSAVGGEADVIRAKADIADGMSAWHQREVHGPTDTIETFFWIPQHQAET